MAVRPRVLCRVLGDSLGLVAPMIRHGSVAVVAGVVRQVATDGESPMGGWPVSDSLRASAGRSRRLICNRCGRVGVAAFRKDQHMGIVCRNLLACWDRMTGAW